METMMETGMARGRQGGDRGRFGETGDGSMSCQSMETGDGSMSCHVLTKIRYYSKISQR
jgi:hypothetical protein